MAEEMRFHRESQVEINRSSGMSSAQAAAAANRQFGARWGIEEEAREARGFVWFTQFKQDPRYATRMLFRHKGFTFVAVITLVLGLSANMAVFGIVHVMFFQPLGGVKDPSEIVVMTRDDRQNQFASAISWADYEDYRDQVSGMSELAAVLLRPMHLSRPGSSASPDMDRICQP